MTKPFRYIDPMSDFGFKKIFSNEEVMRAFLTDVIEPKVPITRVEFLDKEMPGDIKEEHGVVYDLRCRTADGGYFLVEMQKKAQKFFSERIIFYLSRSLSAQLKKGEPEAAPSSAQLKKGESDAASLSAQLKKGEPEVEAEPLSTGSLQNADSKATEGASAADDWNYELHPDYGVFLLNFSLSGFRPAAKRTVQWMIAETRECFSDKAQAFIFELPQYRQLTEQQCKAQTDYWLYNIVNLRNMNGPVPFQDMQPAFKAFGNEAEWANMTPAERDFYQHQLDMWYTNWAAWEYNHEEGYEKGLAAGRAEGRAEGRADIARAMKAKGIAIEVIAECTGLSAEEIRRLK